MMGRDQAVRPWVGRCRYPGHEPFYLGTVILPREAMQHEVDAALEGLWRSISPHAAPAIDGVPGAVFFRPEDQA